VAVVVLLAAIVGKVIGADDFHAYPRIYIGTGASTLAVCAVVLASGLAPLRVRRKPRIARRNANAAVVVRATGLPPSLKEAQRV
jgi:hypothetical protein